MKSFIKEVSVSIHWFNRWDFEDGDSTIRRLCLENGAIYFKDCAHKMHVWSTRYTRDTQDIRVAHWMHVWYTRWTCDTWNAPTTHTMHVWQTRCTFSARDACMIYKMHVWRIKYPYNTLDSRESHEISYDAQNIRVAHHIHVWHTKFAFIVFFIFFGSSNF